SRVKPILIDCRQLSESALPPEHALIAAPHSVAWLEARHLWPRLQNGAGEIQTHDKWKRQLHGNQTAAQVSVEWIHRHRGHLDQTLGWCRLRGGQIAINKIFRRTGLIDKSCFHFTRIRNPRLYFRL